MLYKYGKRVVLCGSLIFIFFLSFFSGRIFNKTFALVGYQRIIANTALSASLSIDHLISIACCTVEQLFLPHQQKQTFLIYLNAILFIFLKLTIKVSLRRILKRRPYKNCSCQKRDTFS